MKHIERRSGGCSPTASTTIGKLSERLVLLQLIHSIWKDPTITQSTKRYPEGYRWTSAQGTFLVVMSRSANLIMLEKPQL